MDDGYKFIEALDNSAKLMASAVKKIYDENKDTCSYLLDPLARWSEKAYGDDIFIKAAKGYTEYSINVAKAQLVYEKNGKYMPDFLEDIKKKVYDDEAYMVPYMWAAILIYAYWPSMIDHIVFFRDNFVSKFNNNSKILELACGHGVLGLLAAEHNENISLDGLDISSHAINIANKLCQASGHTNRVSFQVKDALNLQTALDGGSYQGIIAAMLAEHLEDPQNLMYIIKHHLAPDGIVYFSTALESFQPDHVYEFNDESEPVIMAEKAGLRVIKLISCGSKPQGRKFNPRALAMILTHK